MRLGTRYRWPWLVLIGFLLWALLFALWLAFAARRTRQQRDFNPAPPAAAHQSACANCLFFCIAQEQVICSNDHERRTGTGRAASRAG